jgi:GcrA cell cycle regulator
MLSAFHDLYRQAPELSFDVIATRMSETFGIVLTRNACVGKAHRLGLPQRGHRTGPRKPSHPNRKKVKMVRVDAPIEPEPEPEPEPVEAEEPGISIYQLTGTTCRWPLGSITSRPPFRYCGCRCDVELPYCDTHTVAARGSVYSPRIRV